MTVTYIIIVDQNPPESMYFYEGHDYSKEASQADLSAFDSVLAEGIYIYFTVYNIYMIWYITEIVGI